MIRDEISLTPIGIIHTPYKTKKDTPIQGRYAPEVKGMLDLLPEFADGLDDLDGFDYVYVLYHFHKASVFKMKVIPFLDDVERGLFATRAPSRPCNIGLSICKVVKREGNRLEVSGVDMLDGTPLLDIKPMVPSFDNRTNAAEGWIAKHIDEDRHIADDRFGR